MDILALTVLLVSDNTSLSIYIQLNSMYDGITDSHHCIPFCSFKYTPQILTSVQVHRVELVEYVLIKSMDLLATARLDGMERTVRKVSK